MRKLLILISAAIGLCVARASAADLVYTRNGQPESTYNISNSTISVSSSAVTTIAAVNGYRRIVMRDLTETTSTFYRLDGSTQSITSVGMMMKASEVHSIETNAAVYLQLRAGVASVIINLLTYLK